MEHGKPIIKLFMSVFASFVLASPSHAQFWDSTVKRANSAFRLPWYAKAELSTIPLSNDVLSDVLSMALLADPKMPVRFSNRIQVCTTNLINALRKDVGDLKPLSPMQHVGILIDGYESFTDPGGGGLTKATEREQPMVCHPSPVYVNVSDEKLVSTVDCIGKAYREVSFYSFFDYNCGGFTRDVLLSVGMGMPAVPNGGIGIWYPGPTYLYNRAQILESKKKLFYDISVKCHRENR